MYLLTYSLHCLNMKTIYLLNNSLELLKVLLKHANVLFI